MIAFSGLHCAFSAMRRGWRQALTVNDVQRWPLAPPAIPPPAAPQIPQEVGRPVVYRLDHSLIAVIQPGLKLYGRGRIRRLSRF